MNPLIPFVVIVMRELSMQCRKIKFEMCGRENVEHDRLITIAIVDVR